MLLLLLVACTENSLVAKDGDIPPEADTGARAPEIVVTPASVDFGELAGETVGVATVVIGNVGTVPLHLESLSLRWESPTLSWTALSSPVLRPGEEVETVLTWDPYGPEVLSDDLLVASDDPDAPVVSVPLSGIVPAGEIRVAPATYDFGTLEVGASATTVVTVSNVGTGVLSIDDWGYAATDADMVVIDAGGLDPLPARLGPGESTDVVVRYSPSAGGGDEGALTVSSDDPVRPSAGAQQSGNGHDPCEGFTQTVQVFLTADDEWSGWIDNTAFTAPGAGGWNVFDTLEWELACGDHALSLHARDTGLSISGVIAVVSVEGAVRFVSGPSNWTMTETAPPEGWTDPAFDDAAWHIPEVCADTSPWGAAPQPFYDLGAQWIWWTTDCRSLGEAWLRLNFTVP